MSAKDHTGSEGVHQDVPRTWQERMEAAVKKNYQPPEPYRCESFDDGQRLFGYHEPGEFRVKFPQQSFINLPLVQRPDHTPRAPNDVTSASLHQSRMTACVVHIPDTLRAIPEPHKPVRKPTGPHARFADPRKQKYEELDHVVAEKEGAAAVNEPPSRSAKRLKRMSDMEWSELLEMNVKGAQDMRKAAEQLLALAQVREAEVVELKRAWEEQRKG